MTETGSITAVLKLNTEPFDGNLRKVRENLTSFRNSMSRMGENSAKINGGIQTLTQSLSSLIPILAKFDQLVAQTKSFNQFTKGLLNMSEAVANLSNVTNTSQVGMIRIKEIMNAWSQSARGLTVNLRTLRTEETAEQKILAQKTRMYKEAQMSLNQLYQGVNKYSAEMLKMSQSEAQEKYQTAMLRKEWGLSGEKLVEVRAKLQQMEGAVVKFGNATVITSADLEKMAIAEKKVSATSTETSASLDRASASANRSATSMGRASTQASRLSKAFSSLKMIGTMVGSMLAYNFIHHLGQATNETIQSKSEMEGYFKMLHYGQTDIDKFNKALDQTAQRFQRINKYSLGETISSIGVEFNLTTDEMIKAMDVTSMITSEYLRAGRNANEASLAVKDVLQGQFQRLSRETGVKGEQLKDAGWSGDANDVEGLLDALRKVAEDRNWDVFATKANSLNDIVTILQNRFGEWSADMVNVVQPSIVGAFNSILSFGQGLSSSLSGLWKWLNGNTWEATATKIGLVTTAILTLMPMLTAWRSGATLLQVANMGLTQSLTALVFGIEAETLASYTSSEAMAMRLLGLKAEEVAEYGLINVVRARVLGIEAESLSTELATAGNYGFIGSLYALVTGETLAEASTIGVTGAITLLTGAFLASPIGWFTLLILGLASAFYVLSGGLSDSWEKMKQFNETMQDTGSAQKEANKWLEQVKKDAGEDSQAFKDASDSVENYTRKLQSASYWYQHSQTAFEGSGLEMDKSSKDILKGYGISKEEAEEWSANYDILKLGKDKYYEAEQVLNKQIKGEHSNYAKDLDDYLAKVQKNGGDLEEAYGKMTGNYKNLAEHSYIANTTDSWWEWLWNSFYAGMDQFWIDWDKFWADPQWGDAIDGIKKIFGGESEGGLGVGVVGNLLSLFGIDVPSGATLVKMWDDFWADVTKGIADWQKGAVEWLQPLNDFGDEVNKFLKDPLGYLKIDFSGFNIWDAIFGKPVSASDGSSDHPSFMEDLSDILGFDVQSWIDSFTSDPLGTLGIADPLNIMDLFGALFSLTGGDTTPIMDWFNQTLIVPISEFLMNFMLDPISYIGNFGFTIAQFLDSILPTDFTSIWQWTMDTIVTPIGQGLWDGLLQIPIVGDILALLNLLSNENIGAEQKGRAIANWIGTGITNAIGQIPIVGDLLRLLGLIPQTQPTANSEGLNMGQAIEKGVKNGIKDISNQVGQEFQDAIDAISKLKDQAEKTAGDWADRVWAGVNSVLQRHSPGFIHDEFLAEFGTDIPNAIQSSGDLAYQTAQQYGQQVKDGVASATNTTLGLDSMVGEYQDDAKTIATSSEMMGTNTTTAFNTMQMSVNQSTSQMQGNVTSTYSAMQSKQSTALNSMKAQNLSAYNEMYLKSNQSLIQMRDSTSNVTSQMTNAWVHMKDQIVASANKLKSDSTTHFNQLSSTIGTFYRKIQNPSNWGAGSPNYVSRARRPSAGRSAVRTIRGSRGAGFNPYTNPNQEVSLRELMGMVSSNEKVNLTDFLALFTTGGFGWNDWSPSHYSYIKTQSDNWNMKAPMILGKYQAGSGFRVGDFEGGKPTISFSDYVSTAEAIFGSIPYAFYYNSEKWGSWDNAIKHGEANCSDGADALIALAHTMNPNWSTEKVHTTLKGGTGHFYAVINGKVMDTTAFQNRGSWGHLGAGIPTRRSSHSSGAGAKTSKTVNITIDMSDSTFYGEDDFKNQLREVSREVLREEFNDPFTVAL